MTILQKSKSCFASVIFETAQGQGLLCPHAAGVRRLENTSCQPSSPVLWRRAFLPLCNLENTGSAIPTWDGRPAVPILLPSQAKARSTLALEFKHHFSPHLLVSWVSSWGVEMSQCFSYLLSAWGLRLWENGTKIRSPLASVGRWFFIGSQALEHIGITLRTCYKTGGPRGSSRRARPPRVSDSVCLSWGLGICSF